MLILFESIYSCYGMFFLSFFVSFSHYLFNELSIASLLKIPMLSSDDFGNGCGYVYCAKISSWNDKVLMSISILSRLAFTLLFGLELYLEGNYTVLFTTAGDICSFKVCYMDECYCVVLLYGIGLDDTVC